MHTVKDQKKAKFILFILASNITVQFALVVLASPVLGFVTGKLTFLWLEFIVNDPVTEIMVTLSSAYLTFYIGK